LPVPIGTPPHEPAIHRKVVPEPPVAVNVVEFPVQIVPGVADTEAGATGEGFTITGTFRQIELPQVFSQRA